MSDALWESTARPRFFLVLMGVFAGVALLLAAVGLYGLLAFVVGQRRREIGVRVALGAGASRVRSMILGSGLRLASIGVFLGLGVAAYASRVLEALLFETSRMDAVALAMTALTLLVVAALASYLPARKATAVDPVEVLRHE